MCGERYPFAALVAGLEDAEPGDCGRDTGQYADEARNVVRVSQRNA